VPLDSRPVRRVVASEDAPTSYDEWPGTIPPVATLLREGLDLPRGVTLLVGENGSGKPTLVEAVAMAFGLSPEGGTRFARHTTYETESPLHQWIRLERSAGATRWGFLLRAETMHGYYTYLADGHGGARDPDFHRLSHGEAEAALSFSAQIALVGQLHDLGADGAQVLCATHSPLLAALPGAQILEVGEWGMRRTSYDDLELVGHWRRYLDQPMRYLRHVL